MTDRNRELVPNNWSPVSETKSVCPDVKQVLEPGQWDKERRPLDSVQKDGILNTRVFSGDPERLTAFLFMSRANLERLTATSFYVLSWPCAVDSTSFSVQSWPCADDSTAFYVPSWPSAVDSTFLMSWDDTAVEITSFYVPKWPCAVDRTSFYVPRWPSPVDRTFFYVLRCHCKIDRNVIFKKQRTNYFFFTTRDFGSVVVTVDHYEVLVPPPLPPPPPPWPPAPVSQPEHVESDRVAMGVSKKSNLTDGQWLNLVTKSVIRGRENKSQWKVLLSLCRFCKLMPLVTEK